MAPWSYALAADSSLPCMPVRQERSTQGKHWVAVLLGACAAFLRGLGRRFALTGFLLAALSWHGRVACRSSRAGQPQHSPR